jgi:preprotein translocase subunit SecE
MNTNQITNKTPFLDIASITILVASIYTFVTNPLQLATLYQVLVLLGMLLLFIFVSIKTDKGQRLASFSKETRIELLKVVWPSKLDIRHTTILIMIAVFITAMFLWAVDSFFTYIVKLITG